MDSDGSLILEKSPLESFETDSQSQKDDQKNSQLQFRCPQCLKLYVVDRAQIFSTQPEFQCTKCLCRFAFHYHPGLTQVKTRAFTLPQISKLNRMKNVKKNQQEFVECPKCQTMNPRTSEDCYKCGVHFQKIQFVAKEKKVKAFPSLMKLWQELMNDYSNIAKHMQFVDQCEDLQALPFALKKYKDLKETQPHDSLANQMFDSVIMKTLSTHALKYKEVPILRRIRQLPWANFFRVSPLALGVFLFLIGIWRYEARNMIGAGVALLVLTIGFAYIYFGRVRLEDFWRD